MTRSVMVISPPRRFHVDTRSLPGAELMIDPALVVIRAPFTSPEDR
jgi:hypothetical protein